MVSRYSKVFSDILLVWNPRDTFLNQGTLPHILIMVEVHLDGVKPGIEKHNNKPQSLLIRVDSFSFYYGLFAQTILSLVAGLRCTFCLVSPNVLKFV